MTCLCFGSISQCEGGGWGGGGGGKITNEVN